MVNTDEFTKRLENIFDFYGLTASSFADKIGVQRSSLSHLLSGRNKPSLDFVMKVIEVFPEVDLYWILNGKGTFPKTEIQEEKKVESPSALSQPVQKRNSTSDDLFSSSENIEETKNGVNEIPEEKKSNTQVLEETLINSINTSTIDAIVIFYADGTFTKYTQKK
ncbi:helix-turn-helix domain-containing protein [Flavobacterium sp. NRK F10]|uniref:helix-turn-helix domain-containing protein n=1 Tax=Flavobacterium sp. NRK F10 TaxID=2954931 RepID=UPI0020912CE2|nr:helix-turn-helix transcriptional regulator [Flavobacterium sp. NRK F10]MCO6176344.1 helix-turn-helix domain-containing protein [Flavobacterium sp. NRK F10]